MAEEVRLIFKVDKDGAVNVEQLGAKMKRFNKATKQSNFSLKDLSKSLKAAVAVTGINQAISLFRQLTGVVGQLYQEARQGEKDLQASAVFDQLNEDADLLRVRLQAATSFEVDTTSLERMANQWRIARFDIEDLIRVLPIARKLAAGTGQDFLELAKQIAEGYIKKSPEAFEKFVGKIDVEARAKALGLNEIEKATLRVDEAMRLLEARANSLDLPEARLAQFQATLENLQSSMQKGLAETVNEEHAFADFLIGVLIPAEKMHQAQLKKLAEDAIRTEAGMKQVRATLDFYTESIHAANRETEAWSAAMSRLGQEVLGRATSAIEAVESTINKQIDKERKAAKAHLARVEAYIKLAEQKATIEAKAVKDQTDLERLKLGVINSQIQALTDVADVANRTNAQIVTNWVSRWSQAITNVKKMTGKDFQNLVATVATPKPRSSGGGGGRGPAPELQTDPQSLHLRAQEIQASLLEGQEAIARTVHLAIQRSFMDAHHALAELDKQVAEIKKAGGKVNADDVKAQQAAILGLANAQIQAANAQADADRTAIRLATEKQAAQAVEDSAARYQGEVLALQALGEEYLLATGQASEFEVARIRLADEDLAGPFEREARALREATLAAQEHDAMLAKMADGFRGIGGPVGQSIGAIGDLVQVSSKGSQEIGLASAKMSAAMGGDVASMLDSLALQYAAQAAGYLGAGIIAATTGNPQALGYFAGAAQYGVAAAIAGFSGSTGGGGAGSTAVRSLGTSTPTVQEGGGATYNIYMGSNNLYAEDGPQIGEKLIGHVNKAKHSGKKFAPQVF